MNFKKIVFLFVVILGCMSSSFAFSDLPNDHWAYKQVKNMQETGIISGFTDGTFRPQNPVTREQFATILVKALELEETTNKSDFLDIEQDRWSKQYIDAASPYLTGYLNNGNYYFNPDSYAVREDMAVAVVKAVGLENEIPDYTVLNKFTDKDLISDNLRPYIAIAVENGIMNGNGDGTFNPLGNLTRAEITALMYNVTEKVTNEKEIEEIKTDNIDALVDNINNSRLLDDESMKLILYIMGMQDFKISATKKSENIITVNNKDYNIENNILTFPIETLEDAIISNFILDSVAMLHGVNFNYSEVSIDGSYSIAQNGFEIVDVEEITEYDPETGWTTTLQTGTLRIDISKAPQN